MKLAQKSPETENVAQKLDTRFGWSDHLRSSQSKARRIRQRWDEIIKASIAAEFDSLESHLKEIVDRVFEKIKSLLSEEYFFLSQDLDNIVEKKEKAIKERINRKDNSVEPLEKLIAAFSTLKDELLAGEVRVGNLLGVVLHDAPTSENYQIKPLNLYYLNPELLQ